MIGFLRRIVWVALLVLLAIGCTKGRGANSPATPLSDLRRDGPDTDDPELVGEWLALELISPGGDAKNAQKARARLDKLGGGGMLAHFARGLDDAVHGRLRTAPDHYMNAVKAARGSDDRRAPFIAWFAANRAVSLQGHASGLWDRWKKFVEDAMRSPVHMGWRARGELVEWWVDHAYSDGKKDIEDVAARQYGCVDHMRIAGPFGRGVAPDSYRSFGAEKPGPWPERWPPVSGAPRAARQLAVKRQGCFVRVDEPVTAGIFYAETFVELEQPTELVIAAQGAIAVFIDDERVLNRDPRLWGVWPQFGVQAWLKPGRHRIVARLTDAATSIRILQKDGRPADVKTSIDGSLPYSIVPPRITGEPNIVSRYVKNGDVVDSGDDLLRFLAAYLAWIEGQGDLASVFTEPLVKDMSKATGLVLAASALFAEKDPIFDQQGVRDLSRELHERAIKKDPKLWQSQLALALWQAERAGFTEAVRRVKQLSHEFPDVSGLMLAMMRLYGELGWKVEYAATAKALAQRFPEDVDALVAAVAVYESEGSTSLADQLVKKVQKLDPDSEILLARALAREDYATALAELRKIGKRHPERKDVAERIYDVMIRSGNQAETWKKLESAIAKDPFDAKARLAFADFRYATGDRQALHKGLVDSLENGANGAPLEEALDLIEGSTELEPYRLDAKRIIKDFEKSAVSLPGTAARVLDYAAVWVHNDGSSRMLEHEVIKIQTPEAINQLAEHPKLEGVVLHARVIKKDGRVLEPEDVPGKPTMTFPHLEVGDYLETEHIVSKPSESRGGRQYVGPHWFFREENIAYARSEFVVITPENRELVVETHGNVPPPAMEKKDGMVHRRWRVEHSPAAPSEPGSPPITEFLPSVRVGWGVNTEDRMRDLSDSLAELTPIDPRIVRIAQKIVAPAPRTAVFKRAQRLYRWVLANVEDGPEPDGRRVVISKHGNRWRGFITLCRAIGIRTDFAVARNRLAPPPTGAIAAATQYSEPLVRVHTEKGPFWLTVSSKYAPFGYVPAEVRGVTAYVLSGRKPEKVTTPTGGTEDSVSYEGNVALAPDGSAKLDLTQRFTGKYAMAVRSAFSQLPEAQLRDVIESKLLGRALRGARLVQHRLENLDDLDEPLALKMRVEMGGFAQNNGSELAIAPPFSLRVAQLATLPARQTPLLIGEATHQEVKLRVVLPKGASLMDVVAGSTLKDGDRQVKIADRIDGEALLLDRALDIPAGRVQPEAYPSFLEFARRADAALGRDIRVRLSR